MLFVKHHGSILKLSLLLNPFQSIVRLTFLTLSLTTRFIKKFVQNITSFVVA
jgi:hypothetical protein